MPAKADRTFPLQLLKRAIGLFVAFSVVITAIAYPIVSSYERHRFEVIKAREIGYLAAHSRQVEQTFFDVIGNLNVAARLSAQNELRLGDVASVFKQILEQFNRYNAISLLNPEGLELIRVHRVENAMAVAAPDELRDQSASPSFQEAMRIGPTQIYLSRVIRPPEPGKDQGDEAVIELARAVADEHGNIKGVVALAYDASKLFKELQRIDYADSSNRINIFLNKEGNWFSNSLSPDSPLRRLLDREEGSFAEQFSNEWSTIGTNDHGELRSDKGLFLYTTVYPLKQERLEDAAQRAAWRAQFPASQIDNYYAKHVLWIPNTSLFATSFARQPEGQAILGFGYVMLAAVSIGVAFIQMRKRQEEITRRHAEEMERKAYTDSLTAVWNRRYFGEVTQRELLRSQRHYQPLALILLDIDHFKRINDTYGHKAGDLALKEFCRICLATLREIDIFARLGGEEFVALLPNTPPDKAAIVANRLRESVAAAKTRLPNGTEISFTVSAGVSCLPADTSDLEEILQDADQALYEAKRSGRNRVCISPSCTPPRP